MIYFTSDTHFCHDRDFIYAARGFANVEEHNLTLVDNWNAIIKPDDIVYHLGDVMLKNNDIGLELLSKLNGEIFIIRGNHDTDARWQMYNNPIERPNIHLLGWADLLNYKGYHLYMSHFPTLTGNIEKESLKQCTCNLFGHTHQKTPFYQDIASMYNVGVDAHDNKPVLIDQIIDEMIAKKSQLE